MKVEDAKRHIRRALLKRPQTLRQIAERISRGPRARRVGVKTLAKPIGELVQDREVVRHRGRPPTYSKP